MQQQQQQQEQRRFWDNEIDLLRDSYTPGGGQRTTNYKFAVSSGIYIPIGRALIADEWRLHTLVRVSDVFFPLSQLRVDDPTGVPREANPGDHKTINDKLTSQQAEMNQIQTHMGALGSMVSTQLVACIESALMVSF